MAQPEGGRPPMNPIRNFWARRGVGTRHSVVVVAVATLVVAWLMRVDLVWSNTIPAGGDATGHMVWASTMSERVLPAVSGWSMDWFGGYPVGRFYYPLPAVVIAALSAVVPLAVAVKMLMVLGPLTLPAAAALLLRGAGSPWPAPAVGALAAVAFLVHDPAAVVLGGNLTSALVGEFAYGLALSVGLAALAALMSWVRTGEPSRWVWVILLASTLLSHVLVGVFFLGLGALVVAAAAARRRDGAVGWAIAAAVTGVWAVPAAAELWLTTDPGFPRAPVPGALLDWWWMGALAVIGVTVVGRVGVPLRLATSGWLGMIAVAIVLLPAGLVVSNARLVPLWNLGLALMAAVGVSFLLARLHANRNAVVTFGSMVLTLVVMIPAGDGRGRAEVVMAGLEAQPAWPELRALASELGSLPDGRVAWELFPGIAGYGSVSALQALPYLTDGSVWTLDGLHRESSATSPAIERTLGVGLGKTGHVDGRLWHPRRLRSRSVPSPVAGCPLVSGGVAGRQGAGRSASGSHTCGDASAPVRRGGGMVHP